MKRIRATAHIDPDEAPVFFNLLANSPEIEEARVLEENSTFDKRETFLFAIDGDASGFAERAAETPGVESVEVDTVDDGQAYALLVMRPMETPLFEAIHRSGPAGGGFVFRLPIIYRDGTMIGEIVGDPQQLQQAFTDGPAAIDIQVDEIGRFRGVHDNPKTTLSHRQREALEVALALGYYEQPRKATHEAIGTELGCAPQTASDHLQKAEAKLVAAIFDEFGPTL
jgi:hypothetical protein